MAVAPHHPMFPAHRTTNGLRERRNEEKRTTNGIANAAPVVDRKRGGDERINHIPEKKIDTMIPMILILLKIGRPLAIGVRNLWIMTRKDRVAEHLLEAKNATRRIETKKIDEKEEVGADDDNV